MPVQIPSEKIEEVRLASDIVDVVGDYVQLRNKGRNHFGLCPFHQEKTPSFSVNGEKQIFHCFGCGAGGNVFTFVMRVESMTFPDSVKMLAKKAGITLPEIDQNDESYREKEAMYFAAKMAAEFFQESLNTSGAKSALEYLADRGLPKEKLPGFSIGYAPDSWDGLLKRAKTKSLNPEVLFKAGLLIKKENGDFYDRFRGRVTFAIKNSSGQFVGFGARRIVNDNSPKYINSPETDIYQKRKILYGLFDGREAIRREDYVIVVEGYTDAISLSRAGFKNVVATAGTSLTTEHAQLIRRFTANAIILYDADSAGAAAAVRGADILMENGIEVKICTLPQGTDPDDFARSHPKEDVENLLNTAVALMEFKLAANKEKKDQTTHQRTQTTRELLASIAKVSDQLRQQFMVQDLAKKLGVEERVLWQELAKIKNKNRPKTVPQKEPQPLKVEDDYLNTKKGKAELGLMEAALGNPDLIPKILYNVAQVPIHHNEIRSFFENLGSEHLNLLNFDANHFIGHIQDPVIAQKISAIMAGESGMQNSWQFARDCLLVLQIAVVEAEVDKVRREMKNTGLSKEKTEALLTHYKNLLEAKKTIQNGQYIVEDISQGRSVSK